MLRRQRLRLHHIQSRAGNAVFIQRFDQRFLLNGSTAAHIDDISVGGQQGDPPAIENVTGLRCSGKGHDENFGLRQDPVQIG